jgi:DNA-binding GntR family transcriptional regulator
MATASNRLYLRLKQDIITGVLSPSQSFSEAEFAKRYRASRTPVREACRLLQNEGFITIIPFRGYFVAPLTGLEFQNLQELQFLVDPAAAVLATGRATAEQVRKMESYARYEYKVGTKTSFYEFLQRNFKLHVAIAQATGNRELTAVVVNVHTRLMRYFYPGLFLGDYGPDLVAEHCRIVEAIRKRNPQKARQLAEEHVANTMNRSSKLMFTVAQAHLVEQGQNSDAFTGPTFQSTVEWESLGRDYGI